MEIQIFSNCLELTIKSANGKCCFFSLWKNTSFHFLRKVITFVSLLFFYGYCNIILQPWECKTAQICYLTLLEARSLNCILQGSDHDVDRTDSFWNLWGRFCFFIPSSFWWLPTFLDMLPHHSTLLLSSHCLLFL